MGHSTQVVAKRGHPGAGRKKSRGTPKGRQVDPTALEEVQGLLGERSRQRDLLIEHLHLIQDHHGYLPATHLAALAHEMRISQTEVYEVASFYAHFDVVKEGEEAPAKITVRVCDSIACEMAGSAALFEAVSREVGSKVRVIREACMGRCESAPVVEVGHNHIGHAKPEEIANAVDKNLMQAVLPEYVGFEDYSKAGGYEHLREVLDGRRNRESVISSLEHSELRGLGGAGFPSGRKWRIVSGYPGPRMMAVNADEGEPGTFKDRYYLERDPNRFIEGMLIAANVVEAETVYLYVRNEYPAIREILRLELEKVEAAGLLSGRKVEIRRGAGAYICGEESAMIESIEGKRGIPRNRPPYVAEVGLFGRPTLENNVETLYWVRDILEKGPEWFASAGRHGRKGWRSYSVSGRVKEPGVKLAPAGITARELIEEYSGGMLEGHEFKGYLPGGASGGILPARLGDEPLDFGTLDKHGCFIGSAAVVVFSHHDNMRKVALNLMRFFEDESCGQCTPCRTGTEKTVKLMQVPKLDTQLLTDVSQIMTDASICGLGQAAGNPIKTLLEFFPEDLS